MFLHRLQLTQTTYSNIFQWLCLKLITYSQQFYDSATSFCKASFIHLCFWPGDHVTHLENVSEEEVNRLLGIVLDVEYLYTCVHKEEDPDTKQVYFSLFKVSLLGCCMLCSGATMNDSLFWKYKKY